MLFRAIFWIALVAVLMPREPDLGLGRPGSAHSFVPRTENDASLDCRDYGKTCETALGAVDTFRTLAVKSLAQVKADIEEDERASARENSLHASLQDRSWHASVRANSLRALVREAYGRAFVRRSVRTD